MEKQNTLAQTPIEQVQLQAVKKNSLQAYEFSPKPSQSLESKECGFQQTSCALLSLKVQKYK